MGRIYNDKKTGSRRKIGPTIRRQRESNPKFDGLWFRRGLWFACHRFNILPIDNDYRLTFAFFN